jgi:hypothetical protein
MRPPTAALRVAGTLLATLVALLFTVPASAHPDDVERPGADLVRQAIALLATTPDDRGELREKLDAAQQAEDTAGVDLALVERAAVTLFDGDDPHQARALLEQAVGAKPHLDLDDPAPIRQTRPAPADTGPSSGAGTATGPAADALPPREPMPMARGSEPGATLLSEPLESRPALTGTDWALLVGSLALGSTGVYVALRLRPAPAPARQASRVRPGGPRES